jgi:hypothetical protein
MALEGTHIRFAVDAQHLFKPEDLDKYISGSIYPDSRYPTGIDRTLTHNDSQMEKSFWADDDFRKGWAAHLLYDKIQFDVHTEWFSDILKETNPNMSNEDDWIVRTALKTVQDIFDISQFDIKQYLDSLKYTETLNGEADVSIKKYNQLFIDIYNKAPNVTIEDLEKMWLDWSIPAEIAVKIRIKAYELQEDKKFQPLILEMYEETLKRKGAFYKKFCI